MTVAVIVHVEADRPYVDSLHERLEGVRLIACVAAPKKTPVMAFDPRLPLILVWSAHAQEIGAVAALMALAQAHRGEIIVCTADGCALPRALERIRGARVDASPRSSFFPGGLQAALSAAHHRALFGEVGVRPPGPPSAARRAFSGGVARGLAGTVAVFGVSGAAAMAVEQIPEGLMGPGDSHQPVDVSFLDVPGANAGETLDLAQDPRWAEAEIIVVDASQADVPLATPAPAQVAAARAAAFRSDVPLAVWTPDAEIVAPLESVDELAPWEASSDEATLAMIDAAGTPVI